MGRPGLVPEIGADISHIFFYPLDQRYGGGYQKHDGKKGDTPVGVLQHTQSQF